MSVIEFAKEMCRFGFDGSDLSGGEILELAEHHGVVKAVAYDPEKHPNVTGSEYLDPGDRIYIFPESFVDDLDTKAWECFCDPSYFDMWCVRRKGESKQFGNGYHVASETEARSLADRLNRTPIIDDAELLEAAEKEVQHLLAEPVLTDAEQKAQGARCGCRGADDLCPCQNVPDAVTRGLRTSEQGKPI